MFLVCSADDAVFCSSILGSLMMTIAVVVVVIVDGIRVAFVCIR
jgi:hypothetical protein